MWAYLIDVGYYDDYGMTIMDTIGNASLFGHYIECCMKFYNIVMI